MNNNVSKHKWKCMYTYANSVIGKMDELRLKVFNSNYDIIAITESWAREDVTDAELKINGYVMYRKDKAVDNRVKGGGVLLYVKEELCSCPLLHLTNDGFQDTVWCRIEADDLPVVVGVCYRSTSSSRHNNDSLLQMLEMAAQQGIRSRLLIFGDFNYPEIDYVNYKVEGGTDTDANKLLNKTNDLFLHQHIKEWTRCRSGQQPSTLDYVLTDEDNVIQEVSYTPPLGKSDHVCISLNYIKQEPESEAASTTYDFWKGDYVKIREELQRIDWEHLLANKGTDEAWRCFRDKVTSLTELYIPLKKYPDGS